MPTIQPSPERGASSSARSGAGGSPAAAAPDPVTRAPAAIEIERKFLYFYAVPAVCDKARREYLQEAYRLGREF